LRSTRALSGAASSHPDDGEDGGEGDGLDPEHCPAEHDQQGPEADEASGDRHRRPLDRPAGGVIELARGVAVAVATEPLRLSDEDVGRDREEHRPSVP
jgi:hypothetical protein